MLSIYEKRRLRRLLYTPVAIGILFVLAGLLSVATWQAYERDLRTEKDREQMSLELTALAEREQALAVHLESLGDEYGVERELRSKFTVGREGEHALIFVEDRESAASTSTTTPVAPRKWYDIFF